MTSLFLGYHKYDELSNIYKKRGRYKSNLSLTTEQMGIL